jgi:GNAT superfamily N-acetyltransferase
MIFASTSLAARLERAECRLLADVARAAAGRRPKAGVFARPFAGGIASYTAPGSPLNKVAGLGFAEAPRDADLDALEKAYAEREAPLLVEVSTLADPEVVRRLTRRGYVLEGFENVLARRLAAEPAEPPAEGIAIAETPMDGLEEWLEVVLTGFASPDGQGVPSHESYPRDLMRDVMADMAAAEGFTCFLARREGLPAGAAALRVWEGVATLCGAATRPEHRRHGIQGALLAARLHAAVDAGCDLAVVTTQPGSKSQENVERQGFALLYARAVLRK